MRRAIFSNTRVYNNLANHIKHEANNEIICTILQTHLFKLAYF